MLPGVNELKTLDGDTVQIYEAVAGAKSQYGDYVQQAEASRAFCT
jgi:hypothetical protein